jgi:hypothetical protein
MVLKAKAIGVSLYFSLLTGSLGRDGFAGDWHHRQTVSRPENCSLIPAETARFRAISRFKWERKGSGMLRKS